MTAMNPEPTKNDSNYPEMPDGSSRPAVATCQQDWPGSYELSAPHAISGNASDEVMSNSSQDSNAQKPSLPTKPLSVCPGSCTDGVEPGDQEEEEPSPLVAVPDYLHNHLAWLNDAEGLS